MNNGGEAADQMVREALQFSEVAIKLTALGFKNSLAIALAYAKENPKVRGKTSLDRLLREGKEMKIIPLQTKDLILYPSGASNEEVLARLPADIVLATAAQCYAEVGNEEYLHQMALAVSVEVCGRFGISPPADAADRLNGLRAHIPAGEERRALEEVREMAKVFGDTVCKELDLQRPCSDLQRAEER